MTVKRLMSKKKNRRPYISPDTWVATALRRLRLEDAGAVVVSSDGLHIEGILSERDIVRGISKYGSQVLKFTVSELMSEDVVTCRMSDTALSVMKKMDEFCIRHIPVVNAKDHLEGIISIHDVVRDRLEDVEAESNQMREYISGKAA